MMLKCALVVGVIVVPAVQAAAVMCAAVLCGGLRGVGGDVAVSQVTCACATLVRNCQQTTACFHSIRAAAGQVPANAATTQTTLARAGRQRRRKRRQRHRPRQVTHTSSSRITSGWRMRWSSRPAEGRRPRSHAPPQLRSPLASARPTRRRHPRPRQRT